MSKKNDPQKNDRERFGLVFRERFIKWQPGEIIHLHCDPMGFLKVIVGSVVAGLTVGMVVGLLPAVLILGESGGFLVLQIYLVVSIALAVAGGIWTGLDGRRRDSVIDWGSGSFHTQVGWFTRNYRIEQIYEISLNIEKPKPIMVSSNSDQVRKTSSAETTYTARIYAHAGRKTYILLETAFHRGERNQVQSKLIPVVEKLAQALQVSWYEG